MENTELREALAAIPNSLTCVEYGRLSDAITRLSIAQFSAGMDVAEKIWRDKESYAAEHGGNITLITPANA